MKTGKDEKQQNEQWLYSKIWLFIITSLLPRTLEAACWVQSADLGGVASPFLDICYPDVLPSSCLPFNFPSRGVLNRLFLLLIWSNYLFFFLFWILSRSWSFLLSIKRIRKSRLISYYPSILYILVFSNTTFPLHLMCLQRLLTRYSPHKNT